MIKKAKENIGKLLTAITVAAMVFMVSPAYCDKISDASKQAAEGIQSSAQGSAKWLLTIALVVGGIIFIIGSSRQREGAKEKAPMIVLGIAMIVCAVPLATLIFGWF